MKEVSLKNRLQRFMVIVVALLISNVAALTCAAAMEICSDCPAEPSSHCIEMFDDSADVSVDKSSNENSADRPDNNPFYTTELVSTSDKKSAKTLAKKWLPKAIHSSPPINLLNCVFLK
jgi:hypothetical protein